MPTDLDQYLTPLVPVAEWRFDLYKVTYHADENSPVLRTRWLVSTATHIEGEVWEAYGGRDPAWANWEPVAEVGRPHAIGRLYGMRLDESARSAGEREAKARGLYHD